MRPLTSYIFIITVAFVCFKLYYTFPNFDHDSFYFIKSAFQNDNIAPRPIGYSWFLLFVHYFTTSDNFLIALQYFFLQGAISYLLWTMYYLLKIQPIYLYIISFILIMILPVFLQLSNLIAGDAIFTGLSLIWFTQLIWMQFHFDIQRLAWHISTIFIAFSFRHNAYWYPLISIITLWSYHFSHKQKLLFSLLILFIPSLFILRNMVYNWRETGQFINTGFTGWQLAANGLTAYTHANNIPVTDVPISLREIHNIANEYLDSIRKENKPAADNDFLWNPHSPLNIYMREEYKGHFGIDHFREWSNLGSLYKQYGIFLIRHCPVEFTIYYLVPNINNFIAPITESLAVYNLGKDQVDGIYIQWFQYKAGIIKNFQIDAQMEYMSVIPIVFKVINILYILLSMAYFFFDRKNCIIHIIICCWIANFLFSIVAAPIVLRYQVFHIIITITGCVLIVKQLLASKSRHQY